jgi:hypothetical protein
MCARNAKRLCRKWSGKKGQDLVVESFAHPRTPSGKTLLCPSTQQAVVHGVGNVLGICNGGLRTNCGGTEVGCRNRVWCFYGRTYTGFSS